MRKRIAILCSDDAHHAYLVATLASRFDVVAVVTEPAARQRRALRIRKRYVDYIYAIYHHWRRTLLGLNAYRKRYFAHAMPNMVSTGYRTMTVDSINSPDVVRLLRSAQPDVTVVICTSILKAPVLEAAGPIVLNVHGGFLPYYRGNHCFFFALYNGDFDRIGSTIHFVNKGIDTGDVVERVEPSIFQDDNAEKLYCRAEKLAIDRLAFWLEQLEQGRDLPRRPQGFKGRLYLTRDRQPWHDILLWLRRRMGSVKLPERPTAAFSVGDSVRAPVAPDGIPSPMS